MTIADQLREWAHRDYVFFTCLIVDSIGLRRRYASRFSVKDNGGLNFILSDDPEMVHDTLSLRQEWRRTALCFAADMLESGDL